MHPYTKNTGSMRQTSCSVTPGRAASVWSWVPTAAARPMWVVARSPRKEGTPMQPVSMTSAWWCEGKRWSGNVQCTIPSQHVLTKTKRTKVRCVHLTCPIAGQGPIAFFLLEPLFSGGIPCLDAMCWLSALFPACHYGARFAEAKCITSRAVERDAQCGAGLAQTFARPDQNSLPSAARLLSCLCVFKGPCCHRHAVRRSALPAGIC